MPSPTPLLRHPPPGTTDGAGRRRAALGAAAVALVAVGGLAAWLTLRPSALPVLGAVPPFALTERAGTPLRAEDLRGRVWVADFIFTRCPDVCPALTARMAKLQDRFGTGDDAVRLVSFSVDPVHDTPAVLEAYAARTKARPDWLFVTGPRDQVAALLREGFKVAWADDGPATAPITHSDRFVLVDRGLAIRGYYHGGDAEDLERLARDAAALRDGRRG